MSPLRLLLGATAGAAIALAAPAPVPSSPDLCADLVLTAPARKSGSLKSWDFGAGGLPDMVACLSAVEDEAWRETVEGDGDERLLTFHQRYVGRCVVAGPDGARVVFREPAWPALRDVDVATVERIGRQHLLAEHLTHHRRQTDPEGIEDHLRAAAEEWSKAISNATRGAGACQDSLTCRLAGVGLPDTGNVRISVFDVDLLMNDWIGDVACRPDDRKENGRVVGQCATSTGVTIEVTIPGAGCG